MERDHPAVGLSGPLHADAVGGRGAGDGPSVNGLAACLGSAIPRWSWRVWGQRKSLLGKRTIGVGRNWPVFAALPAALDLGSAEATHRQPGGDRL